MTVREQLLAEAAKRVLISDGAWGTQIQTWGLGEADYAGSLGLAREQKGRVALFLSDHAWLWARGFRDGGPHLDLLRRLGHWLMKEPDLEEEALRAVSRNGYIEVERQTLGDNPAPVVVTGPDGQSRSVPLEPGRPGLFTARIPTGEFGLHRIAGDNLTAFASATACSPIALRVASLMKGDGASSITFWWRRWMEHSRSFR